MNNSSTVWQCTWVGCGISLIKNLKEICIIRMTQTLFREKLNDLFFEIFLKIGNLFCLGCPRQPLRDMD